MKGVPSLGIYRDRRSGSFLIEEYVEDPSFQGTLVVWGNRMPVTQEEMKKSGLFLVLQRLDDFESRVTDPDFRPARETPASYRSFTKKHSFVSIRKRSPRMLEVDPHKRGPRGGYTGSLPEDRLTMSLPSNPDDFYQTLLQAFEETV